MSVDANKSEILVSVAHLYKKFAGHTVVSDLSLEIRKGEIFGFLGPNGSGKTTTIRMLCGLMTPDSGGGTCLGLDIVRERYRIRPQTGYVPQAFGLYHDLTVRENLLFVARMYQVKNPIHKTAQLMKEYRLTAYADILAGRLSGGWKQRLALAAALIHDPLLLFLDEPTAGVDPEARRAFWNDISRLAANGISSLVSTHYMDEAERCNRLAYILNGQMIAAGTAEEMINQTGLISWEVALPASVMVEQLQGLAENFSREQGVEQAAVFGNKIRLCAFDENTVSSLQNRYPDCDFVRIPVSLETVFIQLVKEKSEQP